MKFIDLRSDTVTHPTPEMRQAMAQTEVGDDVYGDDPTVNRLQELAAAKLGKEAALFVPSGTMGNLVAILTHCQRGDEVIVGDKAHTFWYEGGGISAFGGVHSCQLTNQADGSILVDDIAEAVREDDIHQPVTRLVCLENTHNRCGGSVQSLDYTRQVSQLVHERGLKLHLDGARLFNAAAALNVEAGELTQYFDTVTFCLSKGLCCPVGSILCGPREFIGQARRVRKHLGGGMRQVGVLAAAGIVALEQIAPRMGQDHARARKLAEGLAENRGLVLDEGTPQTNMVYFNLAEQVALSAEEVSEKLKVYDILASGHGRRFRLVTHYWIDDAAVKKVVKAFGEIVG
jgi:threonine aldolase